MYASLSLLDDLINQVKYRQNIICGKFIDYDYKNISCFVIAKLNEICKQRDCKVLLCTERSSHVWGTSHSKSDNDVKAIIYYKPTHYYSPINTVCKSWKEMYGPRKKTKQKDIEEKVQEPDVELNCIELTKIGELIIKNDPNVFEIFTSPLIYFMETKQIIDKFQEIIYSTYSWYKLAIHYLAWSNGNHKQLEYPKKKRIVKKPLKILFVVWRGVLSAEWLLNHKKCEGLPLYIPELIAYSRLLSNEEKRTMMMLLTTKLRKGCYEIDCSEAQNLVKRGKEMVGIINQMLGGAYEKGKHSIHKRVIELREQVNITKGTDSAKKLEELVFDVIESFTQD